MIILNQNITNTYISLEKLQLSTICVEGNCPNIGECFSKGKMTFLILGDICTRNCLYCSVNKDTLGKSLNYQEIENIKYTNLKDELKVSKGNVTLLRWFLTLNSFSRLWKNYR